METSLAAILGVRRDGRNKLIGNRTFAIIALLEAPGTLDLTIGSQALARVIFLPIALIRFGGAFLSGFVKKAADDNERTDWPRAVAMHTRGAW